MKIIIENWKRFIKESVNKNFKIFLDMDGVLVAFTKGHAEAIITAIQKDPETIESKSSKKILKKIKCKIMCCYTSKCSYNDDPDPNN